MRRVFECLIYILKNVVLFGDLFLAIVFENVHFPPSTASCHLVPSLSLLVPPVSLVPLLLPVLPFLLALLPGHQNGRHLHHVQGGLGHRLCNHGQGQPVSWAPLLHTGFWGPQALVLQAGGLESQAPLWLEGRGCRLCCPLIPCGHGCHCSQQAGVVHTEIGRASCRERVSSPV